MQDRVDPTLAAGNRVLLAEDIGRAFVAKSKPVFEGN